MGNVLFIEPASYQSFENETEQLEKCRQWGLLSEKAAKIKAFVYKGRGHNMACSIVGYVDEVTAVIRFDDGRLHCIHPSYLKEMQASSFGQRSLAATDTSQAAPLAQTDAGTEADGKPTVAKPEAKPAAAEAAAKPADNQKSSKPVKSAKIELPEDKVSIIATVKEFTTVPNHFTEADDEVIVYEAVKIVDSETEIGLAWSSHSATLKKLELELGDTLTFDAKLAKKKLTKQPVPYKINNPSKIKKL